MEDEHFLDCFIEGFTKAAERSGFRGDGIVRLFDLGLSLSGQAIAPDAFSEGFSSVMQSQ